ncbi:MAG: D-alanyl-D-alanine carboxypeptidase/D-alanyl-D-alanine-endopeptidase [Bacteroidetes bacterium]|nr:D-alanyl-D-alanine carboxypeptidase/D-alanyl-D-alanine-endopeptidase [Bacteroidota bacterium]
MRIILVLVTFSLVLAGCSGQQAAGTDSLPPMERLQVGLAQLFDDPQFDNAHWGVLIRSLKTGETVYARNERKMFMPASNMKLLTSSAATVALTPEYRYVTRLVTSGTVKDSILYGDLIIVGSGDPSISGRFDSGRVTIAFERWADTLKQLGIRKVNGRIIGDDNCFDDEYYGAGWSADYETDYYAAQISGLCFNDNCVDITVVPSSVISAPCSLAVVPATRYVTLMNRTVTAAQDDSVNDIWFERKRGTNTIIVHGTISQGKRPWVESVTVENPTLFTAAVLKEVLATAGIQTTGDAVDVDDLSDSLQNANTRQLASFTSQPFSELVKVINKPSHNMYTEQVLRTLGKEQSGTGSMRTGRATVKPILAGWGVDTVRLRIADGSGLSRQDLITPADIVAILTGMSKEPSFNVFYESLPVAGVDGTIRRRMKGTKAEANVRAKTGTIGYVRNLSGYVTSADGEMFAFSLLANHFTVPTPAVEKVQDEVCVRLANFSRIMGK